MNVLQRLAWWIRRHPTTTVLVVAVCAATIFGMVTASTGEDPANHPAVVAFATGFTAVVEWHRWWTLASWTFMASSVEELVWSVALLVAIGWLLERRVERRAWLLGAVVAIVLGAGLAVLLESLGREASFPGTLEDGAKLVSDPSALGVALATVGSAWASRLVRRRIRSFAIMLCGMLLIYVGHPSDLQRLIVAILGILIGSLIVREPLVHGIWRPSRSHERRAALASMLAVLGVGPIIANVAIRGNAVALPLVSMFMSDAQYTADACNVWHVSEACATLPAYPGITLVVDSVISVLPWLVLTLAAWGVWRGQRMALWVGAAATGALGIAVPYFWIIESLLLGYFEFDADSLLGQDGQWFWQVLLIGFLHLAVAVVLVINRSLCRNQPHPRVIRRAATMVGVGCGVLAVAYLSLAILWPDMFTPAPNPWQALVHLPERFLPQALLAMSQTALQPTDDLSSLLCTLMPVLATCLLLLGLWRIITAPEHHREEPSREERARALEQGSVSSLAAMTQWPEMHSWRDRELDVLVPFRLERGVAIVLAAPLGTHEVEIAARAILAFADYADARAWIPALYSAPEPLARALESHGWGLVEVGEEAVIPLAEWSTSGKRRQDIRTSMNRATREGVEVKWCTFDELTVAEAKHIRAMSEAWVGEKALPEMGFTLGGFAELDDPDTLLGLAISPSGDILAATSWMPVWRDGTVRGRILDFMRRSPDSMNGIMEMLIGSAANRFKDDGLEEISLSAAPLAKTAQAAGATSEVDEARERVLLDRLLDELSRRLEPLYGFRSLLSFKRKFKPEYRPLYLAFPDAVELPAIGFGLTNAYLPELTLSQSWRALRLMRTPRTKTQRPPAEPVPPKPTAAQASEVRSGTPDAATSDDAVDARTVGEERPGN